MPQKNLSVTNKWTSLVHCFCHINTELTCECALESGGVGIVLKVCEIAYAIAFHSEQQAFKTQSKSEKALEV